MARPFEGVVITADPSDDRVLACAVSAAVDVIISGDKHLLALGGHEGIPIVKAGRFLEETRE
jgi:predicted nucleic acid-binding protein